MIHFSWTISATQSMQLQSRVTQAAAQHLGCCTIWVHEPELPQIRPELRERAEILPYVSLPAMPHPWSSTPKWKISARADVVVGCDADAMVWRPDLVRQAAQMCLAEGVLCGTIAYRPPFELAEWRRLFRHYGIPEDFSYRYQVCQQPAPFYINNGVVMLPAKFLAPFREALYGYLPELNARYPTNYFMSQIATTIAIYKAGIPVKALPATFNYLEGENRELRELKQAAFLHYNVSRSTIPHCPHPLVRQRFHQLLGHHGSSGPA